MLAYGLLLLALAPLCSAVAAGAGRPRRDATDPAAGHLRLRGGPTSLVAGVIAIVTVATLFELLPPRSAEVFVGQSAPAARPAALTRSVPGASAAGSAPVDGTPTNPAGAAKPAPVEILGDASATATARPVRSRAMMQPPKPRRSSSPQRPGGAGPFHGQVDGRTVISKSSRIDASRRPAAARGRRPGRPAAPRLLPAPRRSRSPHVAPGAASPRRPAGPVRPPRCSMSRNAGTASRRAASLQLAGGWRTHFDERVQHLRVEHERFRPRAPRSRGPCSASVLRRSENEAWPAVLSDSARPGPSVRWGRRRTRSRPAGPPGPVDRRDLGLVLCSARAVSTARSSAAEDKSSRHPPARRTSAPGRHRPPGAPDWSRAQTTPAAFAGPARASPRTGRRGRSSPLTRRFSDAAFQSLIVPGGTTAHRSPAEPRERHRGPSSL